MIATLLSPEGASQILHGAERLITSLITLRIRFPELAVSTRESDVLIHALSNHCESRHP